MTSTVARGTIDSVASLLAAILYQGGGPGGSMSYVVGLPNYSYKPITNMARVRAGQCKLQKGALDLQPHVIQFTSCSSMVGGSLRVLRLPPPLKLIAMI